MSSQGTSPYAKISKTDGSFNNYPINNATTITKCAIAVIIIFSLVAVSSFVIGIALPLTGFFLEFLSLKLAIIIAFIALSSSLLSVAICIGTKILDSLIVNSKKAPKEVYFPKPQPSTKPEKPKKNPPNLLDEALEELWRNIINQFSKKHNLPKIQSIEINKISKAKDIQKAMKNKDLQDFLKKLKSLNLIIKPEHFMTNIFKLFPNLETLRFENFSKISSTFQKSYKQKEITLKTNAFTMLKKLKTFEMEFFKIKIEKNSFPKSVEKIYFKNNYIRSLSNDAFNNLSNLKEIDLSGNTFKTTPIKKNFNVLSSTKIILTSKNSQNVKKIVKSKTLPKLPPKNFKKKKKNEKRKIKIPSKSLPTHPKKENLVPTPFIEELAEAFWKKKEKEKKNKRTTNT
jgi:fumarate reductase subunit C